MTPLDRVTHVASKLADLESLADPDFPTLVAAQLPGDAASQARTDVIVERFEAIARCSPRS